MTVQTGLPAWERYRPALAALKPGCSDEEARYRCGLMLMRDHAQRRMDNDPFGTMRVVWLGASSAVTQPMPPEDLREVWGAFGRMFMAGRRLIEIEQRTSGGDAG